MKFDYRKRKTVVTGKCGNHAKVIGMAGIWSGAFTRRQLWEGGRGKVGQESEIHGSLPAAALTTHPHAHTCAHLHTKLTDTHVTYTHKKDHKKVIYSSWKLLLTLKVSALGCRKLKQGTDGEREDGWVRQRAEQDCALNSNSEPRLLLKHKATTESWDYYYTINGLHINIKSYSIYKWA